MYQSVASEGVRLIGEALQVPLYTFPITGKPTCLSMEYSKSDNDEVEDLYHALVAIVKKHENISALSSGAILSNYQRIRVENVAERLGLFSLAFLWQRQQKELLEDMLSASVDAILVKVASLGLSASRDLGRRLADLAPRLFDLAHAPYQLNVCGEGGEFETFTTDCPLFRQRIALGGEPFVAQIDENDDDYVAHLHLPKLVLEDKPTTSICSTRNDLLSGRWRLSSHDRTVSPFINPVDRLISIDAQVSNEIAIDLSCDTLMMGKSRLTWCRSEEADGKREWTNFQDYSPLQCTKQCIGQIFVDKFGRDDESADRGVESMLREVVSMGVGKLKTELAQSAGIIPELNVYPAQLTLDEKMGTAVEIECWLSLRRCHRLLRDAKSSWNNLNFAICFATSRDTLRLVKSMFHRAVCSQLSESCFCSGRIVWTCVKNLGSLGGSVEWYLSCCRSLVGPDYPRCSFRLIVKRSDLRERAVLGVAESNSMVLLVDEFFDSPVGEDATCVMIEC